VINSDSVVTTRIQAIRQQTSGYPWELDVLIQDSIDVGSLPNPTNDSIGKVITVKTDQDMTSFKVNDVVTARVKYVGDVPKPGITLYIYNIALQEPPKPPPEPAPTPAPEPSPTPTPSPIPSPTQEPHQPIIDPADFVRIVDNPYYTLKPGTTYVYTSETEDGTERNEVVVTDQTRVVVGVTTILVWDRVWLDKELIEETYDCYAQDKYGNVWYFGEDSKEYEDGKIVSTQGSWESGVDGAKPGVIMEAQPKVGDSYRQEYYKGQAEDMADVVVLGETVTVPYGTFKDCLKTRDWSKVEPSLNEFKYYSSEVGGVVLEVDVNTGERVELVDVNIQ
jgi:hypothetical protein